jgi:hypothetical protein
MLAISLDNLLFFLLIAVAALFQLLSKAISKAGKSDSNETSSSPEPKRPRPIQRAPRESDADRIRKFLEALGQPPSSTPPPPVLPRTDVPPRPMAPVQPPPTLVPQVPWELLREERRKRDARRKSSPPEQAIHAEEVIPLPVPAPASPAFEVHEALPIELQQPPITEPPVEAYTAQKAFAVTKRADSKMNIATLLASKSSLREAILLREVLGTPRGLQALDLL